MFGNSGQQHCDVIGVIRGVLFANIQINDTQPYDIQKLDGVCLVKYIYSIVTLTLAQ